MKAGHSFLGKNPKMGIISCTPYLLSDRPGVRRAAEVHREPTILLTFQDVLRASFGTNQVNIHLASLKLFGGRPGTPSIPVSLTIWEVEMGKTEV
jgi:hypothetical protein